MIEPYYTTLSKDNLALLEALVNDAGYTDVLYGLADILTQNAAKLGIPPAADFSLALGVAAGTAKDVDKALRRE